MIIIIIKNISLRFACHIIKYIILNKSKECILRFLINCKSI